MNVIHAIEAKSISVRYSQTRVLDEVSFSIEAGTLTAIVGPNGAGKTTLIKAILGLIPSTGSVSFFDEYQLSSSKRLHRIAYVPQRADIDWDFPLRVRDVVQQGRYRHLGLFKRFSKHDKELVDSALQAVDMVAYSERQIGELSGGQQQRVFLARALAQDADLLIMDEPFQGVDAATEEAIVKILHELRERGKTVIAVHHDLSTVKRYFDHVLLLNCLLISVGKVEETFTHENLRKTYGGRLVTVGDGGVII